VEGATPATTDTDEENTFGLVAPVAEKAGEEGRDIGYW
jgi:hypothetical protein